MSDERRSEGDATVCLPEWYTRYVGALTGQSDLLENEIVNLSKMNLVELKERMGGDITEIPYDFLRTIFPTGSSDESVVNILRKKRTDYLKLHPEEQKIKDADKGVIGFDGRFYPETAWEKMTPAERRGVVVGTTCFHYNSDTPGMSDTD